MTVKDTVAKFLPETKSFHAEIILGDDLSIKMIFPTQMDKLLIQIM